MVDLLAKAVEQLHFADCPWFDLDTGPQDVLSQSLLPTARLRTDRDGEQPDRVIRDLIEVTWPVGQGDRAAGARPGLAQRAGGRFQRCDSAAECADPGGVSRERFAAPRSYGAHQIALRVVPCRCCQGGRGRHTLRRIGNRPLFGVQGGMAELYGKTWRVSPGARAVRAAADPARGAWRHRRRRWSAPIRRPLLPPVGPALRSPNTLSRSSPGSRPA